VEFLRQLRENIVAIWQRLGIGARTNILVTVLLTVGLVVALVISGSRPQYVPLYSGLDPKDAAAMQDVLEGANIPHKVAQGGSTILVSTRNRAEARLALSAQDLPKHGGTKPGFEMFDTQDFMTTRALQDINFVRAKEGELQNTLEGLRFVESASVSITVADESYFLDEQKPSEASITLRTRRGQRLTEDQIDGVLALAASADVNLSPEHVTLFVNDLPVHTPATGDFDYVANSEFNLKRKREQWCEERAEKALMEVGVRAVVRVSLDMDFASKREKVDSAEEGTILASMTTSTSTSTQESPPEGAPGALANPPAGQVRPGAMTTEETTEETIENYEPTRTVTETSTPPGRVIGAKVAVFVDQDREPVLGEDGEPTGDSKPVDRTQEEIEGYRKIVAAAVDASVEPDDVEIADMPFESLPVVTAAMAPGAAFGGDLLQWGRQWGTVLGQALLVVLGLWIVRRMAIRHLVFPEPEEEEVPEVPEATREELVKQRIASEVEQFSQQQPETVAGLLRSWISEAED